MSNIFAGLDTPKWENPDDESYKSSMLGMEQAAQWTKQRENQQARDDRQAQLKTQLTNQLVTQAKQNQAAVWLHGNGESDNHLQPWETVQEHPELLLDPATSKGTQAVLKASFDYSKAQTGSTEGKIALQQTQDFTKQLDALNAADPATVAQIRSMSRAKDGSPTAMQWQTLSVAQERINLQRKTEMAQAEIDARTRGDNVTVTTGPKGETITAKTPPPAKASQNEEALQPVLKTFEGQHFVYVPKTGKLQKLNESGDTKTLTPAELTKIATSATVDDGLKTMATENLKRLGKPAPAADSSKAVALPASKSALTKGTKYQTARGVAMWDGSQFVQ